MSLQEQFEKLQADLAELGITLPENSELINYVSVELIPEGEEGFEAGKRMIRYLNADNEVVKIMDAAEPMNRIKAHEEFRLYSDIGAEL